MGTKVEGQSNELKSAFTVATQAAGAVTVTAGHIAIFAGANVAHRQMTAFNNIRDCAEALRERGFPDTAAFTTASMNMDSGKSSLTITQGAAIGTLTEDDVAVIYPATFTPPRGSTHWLTELVGLLLESLLETTFKAA